MKKIALFESTGKPEARKWAEYTAFKLRELGAQCCARPELIQTFKPEIRDFVHPCCLNDFEKNSDIVMSFGGDGTMLSAARSMINTDIPIMGINVGKLGFLAEFSVKDFDNTIDDMLKGNYRIVNRTVLETTFNNEKIYALNEFVIEKKNTSRMIRIEAFSNQNYIASIRADGLILTTPTGSTAYSLSCGGPILSPSAEVVCLTPIAPHTLTLRPLVIPDSNEITLKVFSPTGDAFLMVDGQNKWVLKNGDKIVIRRSESKIKLIKPHGSAYYDLLRNKLLWAADPVIDSGCRDNGKEIDTPENFEENNLI